MAGAKPSWKVVATDANGTDHKVGALWSTNSAEVFRGHIDLENNGEKIRLKIFKESDRPKAKPQPARGEQPAA